MDCNCVSRISGLYGCSALEELHLIMSEADSRLVAEGQEDAVEEHRQLEVIVIGIGIGYNLNFFSQFRFKASRKID